MSVSTAHPERANTGLFGLLVKYRSFLLEPGTLFTLASGLLLIIASLAYPQGLFSESGMSGNGRYLYLAAAITGSSYIRWSAIQGILSPVTGALLHELSSIPVIINSARLITFGPKIK